MRWGAMALAWLVAAGGCGGLSSMSDAALDAHEGADGGASDATAPGDAIARDQALPQDGSGPGDGAVEPQRGWKLVWQDEFNGPPNPGDPCYDNAQTPPMCLNRYWSREPCAPSVLPNLAQLNKCVWSIYDIYNWMDWGKPWGYGINALDPAEVKVQGGELWLTAHWTSGPYDCGVDLPDYFVSQQCPIRAGGVMSQAWQDAATTPGFQQTFGRFEVRARLPAGPGAWPAHWLLPQTGGWPEAGEIDIMEATWNDPTEAGANYHGGTYDADAGVRTHFSPGGYPHDPGDPRLVDGYHIYAAEWQADQIRFYIDDLEIGRMNDGMWIETFSVNPPYESHGLVQLEVPAHPFFWILNTSVVPCGGLEEDFSNFDVLEHRIDYLRVYTRCMTDEAGCDAERPRSRKLTKTPWMTPAKWSPAYRVTYHGDFNGDGADDLLLQTRGPGHATYLILSDGQGDLLPERDVNSESGMTQALWSAEYRQPQVGDYNGDGRDDLLLQPLAAGHACYLLLADSSGGFEHVRVVAPAEDNVVWRQEYRRVALGDVDGDGRTDVLLAGRTPADATYIAWGEAVDGLAAPVDITTAHGMTAALWAADARALHVGDFNGDGRADLLLQSSGSNSTLLLYAAVAGGWSPPLDITTASGLNAALWSTHNLRIGDFSGDGADDVVLQPKPLMTGAYILVANPAGSFDYAQGLTTRYGMTEAAWSSSLAFVGDFNGDQASDLLLQPQDMVQRPRLLLSDHTGDFTNTDKGFLSSHDLSNAFLLNRRLWQAPQGAPGHWLFVGDFNGDGKSDLLSQSSDDQQDTYLLLFDAQPPAA